MIAFDDCSTGDYHDVKRVCYSHSHSHVLGF